MIMTMNMITMSGIPIFKKSLYLNPPAVMTRAFVGEATGLAKGIPAAEATAMAKGNGFTPSSMAALTAMGASSTAVAVLL